ncbi:MAG: hypothetical protein NC117_07260 [Pseudoflavonifractor sp.]|nr:hypothetical protein [Pseudoflavonifractor sp.]
MRRNIVNLILLLSLLVTAFPALAAGNVTVKATLDSAYILMGKQTTLHVEVVRDGSADGYMVMPQGDTLTREVEIAGTPATDTVDLGNNRVQILHDIIIQSFDSGLYTLPPLMYVSGNDTFRSNELALKVIPVQVDSLKTIHDYAGVEEPDTRFYDYLPDFVTDYWWIFVILVVIAAGTWVYWKYLRKGELPLVPKKKEIPPYEVAIQELNRLKESHLCERGQEKEYYTRLTDILRTYLDKRFGINAMEMTSTQIVSALSSNTETNGPDRYMKRILEIADFVKFAKVRPLPDDNVNVLQWAMQFVEGTRPVVTPAEGSADGAAAASSVADSDTPPAIGKNDNEK